NPGILKFVDRNHAIAVLLPKFMLEHALRFELLCGRRNPTCASGDERGIFHPARSGVWFGIDDGQGFVWIRSVELLETVQSVADDALVALGLAPMGGLH